MLKNFGTRMNGWEGFIDRHSEREWFESYLVDPEPDVMVLNIFGTGGIGKSTLIEFFRTAAERNRVRFLLLDSRDFFHSPSGFAERLLNGGFADVETRAAEGADTVESAIGLLNRLAMSSRLILVIDTYEEMNDMDHWLRTGFLPRLSENILLILSGRHRLTEEWTASPGWRRAIHLMRLEAFDLLDCAAFAERHGGTDGFRPETLYAITRGHPLTLSLLIQNPGWEDELYDGRSTELAETLKQISSRWLREVANPALQRLIEAASLIRIFNQEHLEYILRTQVHASDFDRLTALSFIRRSRRGWFIHDGLRKAMLQDFRLRKPQEYRRFLERSISYLYRHFEGSGSTEERALYLSDLLYLLGDSTIRATFLDENDSQKYYFKTIRKDSIGELEQYIRKILDVPRDLVDEYIDPHTMQRHVLKMPFAFLKKAYSLINPSLFLELGQDVIRLLINDKGEAGALLIFIPIHQESLPVLQKYPVSRSFFRSLSPAQLQELATPKESPAGLFFYHIDLWGDPSAASRQNFFRLIISLLLQGGIFVISSPIEFYLEVNRGLGFTEVPEALHWDYGPDLPSKTLMLDVRGDKLHSYIKNMITASGILLDPKLSEGMFELTEREREVANMLLVCSTNAEIASRLHITEITVKKHLSRIYEKAHVKNRAEFLRKLMRKE